MTCKYTALQFDILVAYFITSWTSEVAEKTVLKVSKLSYREVGESKNLLQVPTNPQVSVLVYYTKS